MQRTGNILKKLMKDYGLESGLALSVIKNRWADIVGATISAHTFPDIVKGGRIFVTVDTPQWMHHLDFYKQDICDKLKPYSITGIRFKLGKLPEKKMHEYEINRASLSEEDSRYIANTLRKIKDNELKEKLRILLTDGLRNRRK